jgi:hypothetical protein
MQALAETTEIGLAPTLVITLPAAAAGATVQLDLLPTRWATPAWTPSRPCPAVPLTCSPTSCRLCCPDAGWWPMSTGLPARPTAWPGWKWPWPTTRAVAAGSSSAPCSPWAAAACSPPSPHQTTALCWPVRLLFREPPAGSPGAAAVYVCVTTAATCAENQYALAEGAERWSFPFTPTADGTHRIFAYAATIWAGAAPWPAR